MQQPCAGIDRKNLALPLIYFENQWVRVLGAGAELKLPGMDLDSAGSMSFVLRAKYERMGYESNDAPILHGMEERKDSVWAGAASTWINEFASVSIEWLGDASGKSKGQRLRSDVEKPFQAGDFSIIPRIGVGWLDDGYVDYYYGVHASVARSDRPGYPGNATVNGEAALRGNHAIAPKQSVCVSVGATVLGDNIKDSPLVDRSVQNSVFVGYFYRF